MNVVQSQAALTSVMKYRWLLLGEKSRKVRLDVMVRGVSLPQSGWRPVGMWTGRLAVGARFDGRYG